MTHSSKPWVCNTPRNERLSTTNLSHRKNGNVCWPRRTTRESACKLGQAESLTSSETCNAIAGQTGKRQLKRLFQRQFNEELRLFSSPQWENDNVEPLRSWTYLETNRSTKESGFIFPRRSPGAGGSKSAAGRKMLCVFKSNPIVRALRLVETFSTTEYLSGMSS